uniref:TPT domain-containing protein n=4 Tax=Wuchereria bancrofti TaxID=6293 RepID=A0A1I8EPQ3_WUCBA
MKYDSRKLNVNKTSNMNKFSTLSNFTLQVAVIFIAWYFVSSASSIVNKITLQNYPYPMTVALVSLCYVELCSVPVLRLWHIKQPSISNYYLIYYIIPISFGKVIAVVSAYVSVWKVSVSYVQTVKATMPLFAVFSARIVLKERQTKHVYLSLIPIIIGVAIATFTELSFDLGGLLSALLSTGIYSVLNVFVKKVLEGTDIHPLYLLALNSRIAAILLFPVWCFRDGLLLWRGVELTKNQPSPHEPNFVVFLLLSGVLSFLQNLCAFILIHRLSALSYAVANAAKRITVISASLLTLHNPVTPANIFGMFLSIFGVFLYNRAKQREKEYRGLPKSQTDLTISDTSSVFLNGSAIYNDGFTGQLSSVDLIQMICWFPKFFLRWAVVAIFVAILICLFAGHPDIR